MFLLVNAVLFFALLMLASSWLDGATRFFVTALWLEPATVLSMAFLCRVVRQSNVPWPVFSCVSAVFCAVFAGLSQLLYSGFNGAMSLQAAGVGAVLGAVGWFLLHRPNAGRAHVLQEADLRTLGAAIRPHFFFNALNAVMGLIRVNPKQAEAMLQDTAELFRDVMAQDQNRLVTLQIEYDTTLRYARIEQARLAQRLTLEWQIDAALLGAVLPPFSLQLLLENAVRHGIEPLAAGGVVRMSVQREEQNLTIRVTNPAVLNTVKRVGAHNGVALENLRQRLMLMYDHAARLECGHHFGPALDPVLETAEKTVEKATFSAASVATFYTATLTLPLEFEL